MDEFFQIVLKKRKKNGKHPNSFYKANIIL